MSYDLDLETKAHLAQETIEDLVRNATNVVCAANAKATRIWTVNLHRDSWRRYWTYRGILESTRIALEAS